MRQLPRVRRTLRIEQVVQIRVRIDLQLEEPPVPVRIGVDGFGIRLEAVLTAATTPVTA